MKPEKKARLQKAGFQVGSVTQFLNLSEAAIVRINGAIDPIPFHPVGTLPVTKRELAIDRRADAAGKR